MTTVIAIDPGAKGGLALFNNGITVCWPLPETDGDRLQELLAIRDAAALEGSEIRCVIEQVGGFIGKGQPGSAMFKFGAGYGFLLGVIQTLGIPLARVTPQVWQKVFGLGTRASCASPREWKNKLKAEAQRRFPHLPVTLQTADALLILEWHKISVGACPP